MQNPPKSNNANTKAKQSSNTNAFADLIGPFSLPSSNQSLSQKPLNSLPAQSQKTTASPSFTSNIAAYNPININANVSSNAAAKNPVAINSVIPNSQRSTSPAPSIQPNYNSLGLDLDSLDPFARPASSNQNTIKSSPRPASSNPHTIKSSPSNTLTASSLTSFTVTSNTPPRSIPLKNVSNNQSFMKNSSYSPNPTKGIY